MTINPHSLRKRVVVLAVAVCCVSCAFLYARHVVAESSDAEAEQHDSARDEVALEIEAALFTRAEFFGARAIVPYPTAEARNRLAVVLERHADAPEVYRRLAELDEKLGRYEQAQEELRGYVAKSGESLEALAQLAAYQHRRAEYALEAATLERMLAVVPEDDRARLLERLMELARSQKLETYLRPEFYERVVAENPSAFEIVRGYLDRLVEEKNYAGALASIRQYKSHFTSKQHYFLKQETAVLDAAGEAKEAERVYVEAFDPFWPDDVSGEFYQFLSEHERLRAYGHELKEAFRRRPDDYGLAVRLFHYQKQSYEESSSVFVRLEKARAARKVEWKPEELATVARLLIRERDADTASRFLYTLYVQGQIERGSELRAKVLYQLFALLCDAGEERLALTRGELNLYRNIAGADPHPGMLGGVLSFIFSDTNPQSEMRREEESAVEYFNRAAAFRIFDAYRQEYPTSPELAQMYLDIVRLYTATHEPQIAADTLAEFERRYGDAPHYPEVALKLADCYLLLGKHEEERALYQRVLDYLGKQPRKGGSLLAPASVSASGAQEDETAFFSEPTEHAPAGVAYPPKSNPGIRVPDDEEESEPDYYYGESPTFRDFISPPETVDDADDADSNQEDDEDATDERNGAQARPVTYRDVLARYVASLAQENRTSDILALYGNEIKKYPEEQQLREHLLEWLGQTNMVGEQLRVYRETIKRFPTPLWRDRLARWFIRNERQQEFAAFSRELLARLGDDEAESYLERFISSRAEVGADSFDADLYLGLYTLAHERFPHNQHFVQGLLKFYGEHKQWEQWQRLVAEYYFESGDIREQFLTHLAADNSLRERLQSARRKLIEDEGAGASGVAALPYKLFRADAAVRLSNYEEAIDAYRELNRIYPNTPEFAERLVAFTRSLGQHNRRFLEEAASVAQSLADAQPQSAVYRTRAGEIFAELGDYARARGEWSQLLSTGRGEPETYLETATLLWDYYQYADALATIQTLRRELNNSTLYAFQAGAILEAQHQLPAAIAEYTRALDEDAPEYLRTKKRLTTLYRRAGVAGQLAVAYKRERARHPEGFGLVVGYASLLKNAGQWAEAARILSDEAARSDDQNFLERSRRLFHEAGETSGERAILRRQVEVAQSPRASISLRLRLADNYANAGERAPASATLGALVREYPNNYGVLNEAASFYWHLGLRDDALRILQTGMQRGRGRFRYTFARELAARQVELGRLDAARRILEQLRTEDRLDTDVFRELARVYVRTGNRQALRETFRDTLAALKAQDLDIKEIQQQVAELRASLIVAFTQLQDYAAAMEQHVEIINRAPEDEEKLDAAIAYAKRYGGADQLLDYYQRISRQAYKNYRWNVVLARLYEAKGDLRAAAQNYRDAIGNQPELVELYDALAGVDLRAKDYDGALAALGKASELTGDDPQYIKRTVEALERAGRRREAEAARQKLPPEELKRKDVGEQFADAASLQSGEQAQTVAAYRQAFAGFAAHPYAHELRAAEIEGYVRGVRLEEKLDATARTLWDLRARLIAEATRADNPDAGKARELLHTLDGALPQSVGSLAAERADGDELAALYRDWQERVDVALRQPDQFGTLALLQDLAHRAGFGALEEKILLAQQDAAHASGDAARFHTNLRALVGLYQASGDYARVINLLEREQERDAARADFEYAQLLAEHARLVGDDARELKALESYYRQQRGDLTERADPLVERYFEALHERGAEGLEALRRLAAEPSPSSLQLVNFLIAHGESELAHEAIERSSLPRVWKLSRNAEVSLVLKEFDARGDGYFVNALQLKSIGELVARPPDVSDQLVGDDWVQMTTRYGQWLALSGSQANESKARAMLPASVENRPHDADEQAKLGRWYLEHGEARRALAHLEIAHELDADAGRINADTGAAYLTLGERERAFEFWSKLIAGDEPSPASCELFLETLSRHQLAGEARKRLSPVVIKRLKQADEDGDDDKEFEPTRRLLRALANSFNESSPSGETGAPLTAEAARAQSAYFVELAQALPEDTRLPELLVNEKLVARDYLGEFYSLLVARSVGASSYERDYSFASSFDNSFNPAEVEEAYDHENNYRVTESDAERLKRQRGYVEYLLGEGRNAEAARVVATAEAELRRKYARPEWLRLAAYRLELRAGKVADAFKHLSHFVGVETVAGLKVVAPPNVERLNAATALLKDERQQAAAAQLLEAAYARFLALEQYEQPYFDGLARLAFERGETEQARKLLRLMIALAREETRDAAVADVAALPAVKAHAIDSAQADAPEPRYRLNYEEALSLAADASATFADFETAIEFRRELQRASAEDYLNRVELARVLAAANRFAEATAQLAAVIGDRNATRDARWQAVWLAPEVTGGQRELWASLRAQQSGASNPPDGEMLAALKARELASTGRAAEALQVVAPLVEQNPNAQLRFFASLLARESGQDSLAVAGFAGARLAARSGNFFEAFARDEDAPRVQLIRLYLARGQKRAALKLAESPDALAANGGDETTQAQQQPDAQTSEPSARYVSTRTTTHAPLFETLRARTQARRNHSALELLGLLSQAAEEIGDLPRAIEFEQRRLALDGSAGDVDGAQDSRFARLQALQRAHSSKRLTLTIDRKLLAQK